MVTIIFESHGTSLDNEKHLSSGHNDVELSPLGIQQAKELGERYKQSLLSAGAESKNEKFDAIFVSDLQRSYKTAEIAFGDIFPIIKDKRLRECDYGDLTKHSSNEVDPVKAEHISTPFPNGESYEQTCQRMKEFLDDLKQKYDGRNKNVLIIGHRATQYGLEHWIKEVSIRDAVTASWKWQPGWEYELI